MPYDMKTKDKLISGGIWDLVEGEGSGSEGVLAGLMLAKQEH